MENTAFFYISIKIIDPEGKFSGTDLVIFSISAGCAFHPEIARSHTGWPSDMRIGASLIMLLAPMMTITGFWSACLCSSGTGGTRSRTSYRRPQSLARTVHTAQACQLLVYCHAVKSVEQGRARAGEGELYSDGIGQG